MAEFKPRFTKPEAGNKYYIRKASGGWNPSIKGNPTDAGCDVLSNCVGYAIARYNEIGGHGSCKYLRSTNAENFLQVAKEQGLPTGTTPKLGAVMVWRKGATLSGSDGAGHVAIVEQINSNGSIVTSESGWGCAAFWTQTRKKGSGNWGAGTGYTFLGFIYQPAEYSQSAGSTTTESAKPGNAAADSDYTLRDFIEAVQQVTGSAVDGKAGPETISNTPTLSRVANRKHPAVRAVQRRLQALGYNLGQYGADGVYGAATAEAVKKYQRANGCVADGVITKKNKTWRKLLGME